MNNWEEIGSCDVDAGLLMIGDPCYFIAPHRTRWKDWGDFLDEQKICENGIEKNQIDHSQGNPGMGVVFATTHGDGTYSVYVIKNKYGHPRAAIVIMDDTPINKLVKT